MDYIMSKELEEFLKDQTIEKKFPEINKIENKTKDEILILKIKYLQNLLFNNADELSYYDNDIDNDILEKRNFILKKVSYNAKVKSFINDFRQVLDVFQLLHIFLKRNVDDEILYNHITKLSNPNTKNINSYRLSIINLDDECDKRLHKGLLGQKEYDVFKKAITDILTDIVKMNDYKINKTKLLTIQKSMSSRIKDDENKIKLNAFVENISSSLDVFYQIEQYNDFTKKSSSKIHFNPKSFGCLSEDILIENFSTFDLKKYDISKNVNNTNIIEEIISFSQKYNNMPEDFTKNHNNIINFVSNILHILIKDDLDKLSEKELIILHKDLQELIISYVYIFNTVKTQYNFTNNDLFKVLSNNNSDVLFYMNKLSSFSAFSKEYDVTKEQVIDIKNNILESIKKFKLSRSPTNDFINSKREDNAILFNREHMSIDMLSGDSKFYLSNITSNIGDKMLNLNYFNPLINVFKFWTNFILNYNQNIYMEKYNRPIFIFNKNLKDINIFIKDLENAISTGNVNSFIERNIEWTGESLAKKITSTKVSLYHQTMKLDSKKEAENFDFNNFM